MAEVEPPTATMEKGDAEASVGAHPSPEDLEAADVAVGSIGHILRNNFADVIAEEDEYTAQEEKKGDEGEGEERVEEEGEGERGEGGGEEGGEEGGEGEGGVKLGEEDLAEMAEIDATLSARNAERAALSAGLQVASERAAAADAAHARAMRRRGLVQGEEVSLPPSMLEPAMDEKTRGALRARAPGASAEVLPGVLEAPEGMEGMEGSVAGGALLSAAALLEAHEREQAVRRGQVQVGEEAPDFFRTVGKPHYLTQTASLSKRVAENRRRFLRTTGKFGAEEATEGPAATALQRRRAAEEAAARAAYEKDAARAALEAEHEAAEAQRAEEDDRIDAELAADLGVRRPKALSKTEERGVGGKSRKSRRKKQAARRTVAEEEADAVVSERMARTQKYLRNPRTSGLGGIAATLMAQATAAAEAESGVGGKGEPDTSSSFLPAPSLDEEGGATSGESHEAVQGSVWVAGSTGEPVEIVHSVAFRGGAEVDKDAIRLAEKHVLRGVKVAPLVPRAGGARRAGPFLVTPGEVSFHNPRPEEEYSMSITLRNADTIGRSLRILPPTSSFFRTDAPTLVGLGAPKRRGDDVDVVETSAQDGPSVLAPGIGVKVVVHMWPDSLANHEDALVVLTELGKFAIPVRAIHAPQRLTIPPELALGRCLARDRRTASVAIRNTGSGHAVCRIFAAEQWPPGPGTAPGVAWKLELGSEGGGGVEQHTPPRSSSRASGAEGKEEWRPESSVSVANPYGPPLRALDIPPFTLHPTHFDLDPGEEADLCVEFAPPTPGHFARTLYALFSNGQVTRFQVSGDCAELRVGVVAVAGQALASPEMGPVAQIRKEECRRGARDAKAFGKSIKEVLPAPHDTSTMTSSSSSSGDGGDARLERRTHAAMASMVGERPMSLAEEVCRKEEDFLEAIAHGEVDEYGVQLRGDKGVELSDPSPSPWGPLTDAPARIRFDALLPGGSATSTITIHNDTPLELPFEWKVLPWSATPPAIAQHLREGHEEMKRGEESDRDAVVSRESAKRVKHAVAAAASSSSSSSPSSSSKISTHRLLMATARSPGSRKVVEEGGGDDGGAEGEQPPSLERTSSGVVRGMLHRSVADTVPTPLEVTASRAPAAALGQTLGGTLGDGGTSRPETQPVQDTLSSTEQAPSSVVALGGVGIANYAALRDKPFLSPSEPPPSPSPPSSPPSSRGGGDRPLLRSPSNRRWLVVRDSAAPLLSKYEEVAFSIEPSTGTLPAYGSITFNVHFSPASASIFEASAKLLVTGVPSQSSPALPLSASDIERESVSCATVYMHGAGKLPLPQIVPSLIQFGSLAADPATGSGLAAGRTIQAWTTISNPSPTPLSFVLDKPRILMRREGVARHAAGGVTSTEMLLQRWAAHARGETPPSFTPLLTSSPSSSSSATLSSTPELLLLEAAAQGLSSAPESVGMDGWIRVDDASSPSSSSSTLPASITAEPHKGVLAPGASVQVRIVCASERPGSMRVRWPVRFFFGDAGLGVPPSDDDEEEKSGGRSMEDLVARVALAGKGQIEANATVSVPTLRATEPELDVGLCRTLTERVLLLQLQNPCPCEAPFEAFVVPHVLLPQPGEAELLTGGSGDGDGSRPPSSASSSGGGGGESVSKPSSVASGTSTLASALGPEEGGASITFDPPLGVVPAFGEVDVRVVVRTGPRPQRIRETLGVRVRYDEGKAVFVRLRGEVQAPLCHLSTRSVDLGVCFLGVPVSRSVTLQNLSNLRSEFRVDALVGQRPPKRLKGKKKGKDDLRKFQYPRLYTAAATPAKGQLGEKESLPIDLSFIPSSTGPILAPLTVDVHGLELPLVAEVRALSRPLTVAFSVAQAKESTSSKDSGEEEGSHWEPMFATTEGEDPAELWESINKAAADAGVNRDTEDFATLHASFTAATDAHARVASIPPIHFGDDFLTFSRRTVRLVVRNLSGVATDFFIAPRKYPAYSSAGTPGDAGLENIPKTTTTSSSSPLSPQPSSSTLDSRGTSRERRRSRGRSRSRSRSRSPSHSRTLSQTRTRRPPVILSSDGEDEQRFQSKQGREELHRRHVVEVMREQLSLRNGCAFQVWPSESHLPPFGTAEVLISCVADMPGDYSDTLDIFMDGHNPLSCSLSVSVLGSPLDILPTIAGLDAQSRPRRLRFGDVPAGAAPVSKVITIVNTAPMDAVIRWNVMLPRAPSSRVPIMDTLLQIQGHTRTDGVPSTSTLARLEAKDEEEEGAEEEGEEKGVGKRVVGKESEEERDDGESGVLKFRLVEHSLRNPPRRPPFNIVPESARVPAQGSVTFRVDAEPRRRSEVEALDELHLGWGSEGVEGDWEAKLGPRRGLLVADALWIPRGSAAPPDFLSKLDDSQEVESLEQPLLAGAKVETEEEGAGGEGGGGGEGEGSEEVGKGEYDGGVAGGEALKVRLSRDAFPLVVEVNPVTPSLAVDERVDKDGRQWVHFAAWATKHKDDDSFRREVTLTNELGVALTFALDVQGPFVLERVSTRAPRVPPGEADLTDTLRRLQSEKLRLFTLSPRSNLTAIVRFDPSRAPRRGGSSSSTSSASSILPGAHGTAPEQWHGNLRVRFAAGTIQVVHLRAVIARPQVVAHPPVLDLGRTHAEASVVSELHISNPSEVTADWSIVHIPWPKRRPKVRVDVAALGIASAKLPGASGDDDEDEGGSKDVHDDPTVFGFSLRSGALPGPTVPLETADGGLLRTGKSGGEQTQPQLIGVRFAPGGKVGLFRSKFRIRCRGGEPFDFVAQAYATHDEDAAPLPRNYITS